MGKILHYPVDVHTTITKEELYTDKWGKIGNSILSLLSNLYGGGYMNLKPENVDIGYSFHEDKEDFFHCDLSFSRPYLKDIKK